VFSTIFYILSILLLNSSGKYFNVITIEHIMNIVGYKYEIASNEIANDLFRTLLAPKITGNRQQTTTIIARNTFIRANAREY